MDIRRRITIRYLEIQYRNAKRYLRNVILNGNKEHRNIKVICNDVRNAGIAYAQTRYCFFSKDGSFREDMRSVLGETNEIRAYSLVDDFIKEMELEIENIVSQK